jgi:asparagine synthase (glutamine-hydrolysing)
MCGIAGFTKPQRDAREVLAAMNRALAHRGPDGRGTFIDREIAFGHTRLAIIDPAGGAQPRVDPESGDALVFNGEIYGYRELAGELRGEGVALADRSDTEVLFQLIRKKGLARALARIDGMFAFAYRDGRTGALHLVRDRFGEKPLYYGVAGGEIVFGSEASAVLAHPRFQGAMPDPLSAYRFLLFEYLPGQGSGWAGIEKLAPGTILSFEGGRIRCERYFEPRIAPSSQHAIDEDAAVERLGELLLAAVQRRIVADVPVGILLSGGLDSSLVAALAAKASPGLVAFSVRVADQGFDETPHAAAVARHLGVSHEIVGLGKGDLLEAFDAIAAKLAEPLGDSSLLPSYLVCRAARRLMTVALGGDGADELFAGYPNFAVQRYARAMRLIPPAIGRLAGRAVSALGAGEGYMNRRFLVRQLAQGFGAAPEHQSFLWMAPLDHREMARLWRPEALPRGAASEAFAPIDRHAAEIEHLSAVERLLHLFLVTYLPEDILAKVDRASMFNSLEVRAPFLDPAVAEFACALPTRLKLNGGGGKHLLKRLGCRHLPAAIATRKKHGFAVPIGSLIRTLFWERCRDTLLSRDNPVAGWFDRGALEGLLDAHKAGRRDHGKKLWALTILFLVAGRQRERVHEHRREPDLEHRDAA